MGKRGRDQDTGPEALVQGGTKLKFRNSTKLTFRNRDVGATVQSTDEFDLTKHAAAVAAEPTGIPPPVPAAVPQPALRLEPEEEEEGLDWGAEGEDLTKDFTDAQLRRYEKFRRSCFSRVKVSVQIQFVPQRARPVYVTAGGFFLPGEAQAARA
jgi:hypothetical protein